MSNTDFLLLNSLRILLRPIRALRCWIRAVGVVVLLRSSSVKEAGENMLVNDAAISCHLP